MFTSLKHMLDYYLHFTDFEDIFANMLCCINICFAWDLLLKSEKENHILLLNIIFYGKTVFTSATCNWWTSVRYNGPCSCVLCYHTQKRNNHLYWKISFSCIFAKKSNLVFFLLIKNRLFCLWTNNISLFLITMVVSAIIMVMKIPFYFYCCEFT